MEGSESLSTSPKSPGLNIRILPTSLHHREPRERLQCPDPLLRRHALVMKALLRGRGLWNTHPSLASHNWPSGENHDLVLASLSSRPHSQKRPSTASQTTHIIDDRNHGDLATPSRQHALRQQFALPCPGYCRKQQAQLGRRCWLRGRRRGRDE